MTTIPNFAEFTSKLLDDAAEMPDFEELLSFHDRWVNLGQVESFEASLEHGDTAETKLLLSNGKELIVNMSCNNFLIMLDVAGLIPNVTNSTRYGN